jgi:murein DD-endopeptidase MepM/ murein hydrolase activator NlpD
LYQVGDISAGSGSGTATLALNGPFGRPAPRQPFGHKLDDLRARTSQFDLVVDLGQRIGSRTWLRGFATCFALCYGAWSLGAGVQPLWGRSPPPLGDMQFQEARATAIAPLAYGADTGRRMAPTAAVEMLAESPERPIIDLRATLGRGDGFASVLERAGIGAAEADTVAALIGGIIPLSDIRTGTVMDLTLGRRPNRSVARPLEKLTFRARFDLRVELSRADGALKLTQIPIAVDDTPLRIQGLVGSSLYRSARAAGVPARAVEAYIRALSTQLNVAGGINSDDRFDIIIGHRRAATGEVETGPLLFAGLKRSNGRSVNLMQWEAEGRTQWFEASGVGRQSGGMTQPVPGPITSNYGLRMHPILGYARMHRGIDMRASYGTPILAVADGSVARAGWAGGYGRQVRLNHANGLASSYSHMSRIAVQPGARVRQGQVIGYIGTSGLSTGPHLHFETYRNGATINPRSVRFVGRAQLSGTALASFRSRLRALLGTPLAGSQRASAGTGATRAAR